MDATVNLSILAKEYSDEDAARELLESWRWPNGAACPHCGGTDPYKLTPKPTSKKPGRKGLYKCRACRKQFTVTVGTVFEDSRIPLSKWMLGVHLLASSKKGISAHQLHRMLGISYKAAWFMAHRLRYAMADGPLAELLKGIVEADETYLGGRRRIGPTNKEDRAKLAVGRPGPLDKKLTPVVGMVERGGRVRVIPVARVNFETMKRRPGGPYRPGEHAPDDRRTADLPEDGRRGEVPQARDDPSHGQAIRARHGSHEHD
jgi:transposase-like protein